MDKRNLQKAALASRLLSIDAIQKANSGHPGLPLGAAELGAYLYGHAMNYYPDDPKWINRDRFVLSAGHGSMFLYSYLHLAGYDISLDDIKHFRKYGSKCPGHPEYGVTPGVEATTGPLGQGVAMAVGMAIAETMAGEKYNTREHSIIDHYTYVLAGDGDLSEGVSAEASSLAGHLKLGKLILFYDSNNITIDGNTDLSFTEDVEARYVSYGWQVLKGSMYDLDELDNLTRQAKNNTDKPTMIILKSIIGKGSPNKQGTSGVHGAALGEEEVAETKLFLNANPLEKFVVDSDVYTFFEGRKSDLYSGYSKWQKTYLKLKEENPNLAVDFSAENNSEDLNTVLTSIGYKIGDAPATREASSKAINYYAEKYGNLVGGSADLSGPNRTGMAHASIYSSMNRNGRYIHYGVREFAMAAIANGMALYGGFKPFVGTFLVFSDYLRPALRLSALMKLGVIYVLSHDSIYVGEDGPTHQPIEQLAALRAIPNVSVQRPADAEETIAVWDIALKNSETPTVIALTRQGLPVFEKDDKDWMNNIRKGAYIAREAKGEIKRVVVATGSEVTLVLRAISECEDNALSFDDVRVISMPDREKFYTQPLEYISHLIPDDASVMVVEAGIAMGWDRIAARKNILSIEDFGESAPAEDVASAFGFTEAKIIQMLGRL
ncbi:transketolase [Sphaerochaeta pleomorpha str. Grapes]|uniref:Transketolase n=1 Tax=Sphaerochaeta pleomorpha (strain ATCC BAA-1885 / DSM 22778 / Grapes) TaxID=158190 RepID=G8QTF9_SPHPG|nr:transketolase [Sphaerochaeta pleomorpha]AEV30200.1 transketolase [Sphaerochaeta pleomorpha str. Grapes]